MSAGYFIFMTRRVYTRQLLSGRGKVQLFTFSWKGDMLLDDLKHLATSASLKGCVVGRWISTQEPEVAALLDELPTKPNFSVITTYDVIRKNDPNIPFKRTAFGDHMRKVCACQAI